MTDTPDPLTHTPAMARLGPVAVARYKAVLEALLFVAPAPVAPDALHRAILAGADPATPQPTAADVLALLDALNADMVAQVRGLRVMRTEGPHFQLVSAPDPQIVASVERFLNLNGGAGARLSNAALETLTIIGYRQPVTRSEVEGVRGVDSSGVINTLVARGLIEEVGRAQTLGRPALYATTPEFLHHFGLTSLADLPTIEGLGRPDIAPP